jgi:hypothetical protein
MVREKWGLLAFPNTATRTADRHVTQLMSLRLIPGMNSVHGYTKMRSQLCLISTSLQLATHAPCKVLVNLKDDYDVNASVHVVHSYVNYMLSTDINITETTYCCQF